MAEAPNNSNEEPSWEDALEEQKQAEQADAEPSWEDALAEQSKAEEAGEAEVSVSPTVVEATEDHSINALENGVQVSGLSSASGSRIKTPEVPVSTIVGLMGLSSKSDIRTLETKIDSLGTKVTNLSNRLERVTDQLMELFNDIDRTNTQFGDLKNFLKNILSSVVKDNAAAVSKEVEALGGASSPKGDSSQVSGDSDPSVNVISSE